MTMRCDTCGKEFETPKQLNMHKLGAHWKRSVAPAPAPEEEKKSLPPFQGIPTIEQIKDLAKPFVLETVKGALTEMNIPAMLTNAVNEAVNKKVDSLSSESRQQAQQQLTRAPSSPSGDTQNQPSQLQQTVLTALAQKIISSGSSSSNDLAKLTEMMKAVGNIADLANTPYRQGRLHALQETNEMIKLMRGIGGKQEDIGTVIGALTGAELKGTSEES